MGKIVVTGLGIVSAIGQDVAQNRQNLKEGKTGITSQLDLFPTRFAGEMPFGTVKKSTADIREALDAREPGTTRTDLLALHAFLEAVQDSTISTEELRSPDTALVASSTVGGMCLTDELFHDANEKKKGSAFLSSYDNASPAIYLQKRFRLGGIINTINTACSSSANAILYGAGLLKNGLAKRVLAGGADSLAKFTINGFNSLFILSDELCSPFDENRKGLNLGEGAAFLVLEREEDVRGKKIYAGLAGYCNSNDAYHPSSLSEEGDGPWLAMHGALQYAGLDPDSVDFINAHGTGTENNDAVESRAMLRLFKDVPAFASTKSYTGHTLGASGAMEAVFSVISLVNQECYPSLHFHRPIPSTGLIPVRQYEKKRIQHIMSNSFGFGGNCSTLIFSAG